MANILVINPNSSETVTRSMDACLDSVRRGVAQSIQCVTLETAPPGIETDAHIAEVTPKVRARIADTPADAYVVACFSDPGVGQARQDTPRPVIGIGEAGYLAAIGLGGRFGVVSIVEASIGRHRRHLESLGLSARLAGDRPIGFGVAELGGPAVIEALVRVGHELRDRDGADTLVLGCAGMGGFRAAVEAELGLPVVDPVQAGALLAANALTLSYPTRPV